MRSRWQPGARAQLLGYLEERSRWSEDARKQLALKVRSAEDRVREFPRSGRIVPEWSALGVREIVVDRYRLLYHIAGDVIEILALHPAAIPLPTDDNETH